MNSQKVTLSLPISDNNTQRINFIAGRSLSEQEFDLMQTYVDERCEDLLLAQLPGIVNGLELLLPQNFLDIENESIQIEPGIGISYSGKVVTNQLPIRFKWKELMKNYLSERAMKEKIKDGYYFLTLRRRIVVLDEVEKTDPAVRTELNPLRDTRLETIAQVNLQYLPSAAGMMLASRQRVVMYLLQSMLNPINFSRNPDEIKLAMIKIKDNLPVWIDNIAGRFMARENSCYFALMDYWHRIVKAPHLFRVDGNTGAEIASNKNLNTILDIDYLPAAGLFPEQLIRNIAGKKYTEPDQADPWPRPEMLFDPDGLQIEMLPVPANSVSGVIQTELMRGVVDLVNPESDRIRLMVAVEPNDYHPRLMDLPEIDYKVISEGLIETEIAAYKAYKAWAEAYYALYKNIESNIPDGELTSTPSVKTREIFSSIYLASRPNNSFSKLVDKRDFRKKLTIPDSIAPPDTISNTLESIRNKRREKLKSIRNVSNILDKDMPRPWSLLESFKTSDIYKAVQKVELEQRSSIVEPNEDGLIQKRIDTKQDIEEIEGFILRTNKLIDEVRDYLSSHRQQLDAITVSFSSLAGGIPGDGTGLKLMRWSDRLTIANKEVK